jgi:hypothetical protein
VTERLPNNYGESRASVQLGPSIADSIVRAVLVGAVLVCTLVGCGDPVQDSSVAALGAEAPGVPKGPLHRPGQPCVLCHSDQGGASPFLLAGTVYVSASSLTPIDGVQVNVVDSLEHKFATTTNCAGNFWVLPQDYMPDAPLWVSLKRDAVLRVMNTAIYREGSCAGCHADPQGPASVGHVYLIDDPTVEKAPVSQCQ